MAVFVWIFVRREPCTLNGSTHASRVTRSWGGVARNIAECLSRLGAEPILLTALGEDAYSKNGNVFDFECRSPQPKKGSTTSSYTAVLDDHGECLIGFGDMTLHDTITPEWILSNRDVLENAPLIVIDGNLSVSSMSSILELAQLKNIPVFFEPTDLRKAVKPFKTNFWKSIKFMTPNLKELKAIANCLGYIQDISTDESKFIADSSTYVAKNIDNVLITMGKKGVLLVTKNNIKHPYFNIDKNKILLHDERGETVNKRFYAIDNEVSEIVSVSGAGDCLAAGFIFSMLNGKTEEECMTVAFNSAAKSLTTNKTVPDSFFDNFNECWSKKVNFKIL